MTSFKELSSLIDTLYAVRLESEKLRTKVCGARHSEIRFCSAMLQRRATILQ